MDSTVLAQAIDPNIQINAAGLPIVSFGELLTFIIRLFFFIAGVAALIYGLWGALSWITSGGSKEDVETARNKIQAAIVGVFIVVVVLSIVVALEQFVFNKQLCFGLSCPAKIPELRITPLPGSSNGGSGNSSADSNTSRNSNGTSADNSNGNSNGSNNSSGSDDSGQLPATGGGGR